MKAAVAFAVIAAVLAAADARNLQDAYDPLCKFVKVAVCETAGVDYGACGYCDPGYACVTSTDTKCIWAKDWVKKCDPPVKVCKPILKECGDDYCKYDEECQTKTVCKKVLNDYGEWVKKCWDEDVCVEIEDPKICEIVVEKVCKKVPAEDYYHSEEFVEVCEDVKKEVCKPYEAVECGIDHYGVVKYCEIGEECIEDVPCKKVAVPKKVCDPVDKSVCVKSDDWVKCGDTYCGYGYKCVWKKEKVCEDPPKYGYGYDVPKEYEDEGEYGGGYGGSAAIANSVAVAGDGGYAKSGANAKAGDHSLAKAGSVAVAGDGGYAEAGSLAVAGDKSVAKAGSVAVAGDGGIAKAGAGAVAGDNSVAKAGSLAVAGDGGIAKAGAGAVAGDDSVAKATSIAIAGGD